MMIDKMSAKGARPAAPGADGNFPALAPGDLVNRRLLMIVPWLVMGGADRFNLNLVQLLTARGWQVTLVTTETARDSWRDEFARHASEIFLLHQTLELPAYPAFIRDLVRSRQPAVVLISNSELGYLLLPYLRACCPGPLYLDFCHSEELHWRDGGFPALSVQQRDHLDGTLVASGHLKRWMVGRGARADRLFVRYINVDTEQWRPDPLARSEVRRRHGIATDAPVVLYAARLSPEKLPLLCAETLHELASRYPSMVALVAGEGELRGELLSYLERHGLAERIKYLGNVPADEMPALMAACDIFFLPSLYEGISLAVYEAMACGAAVVAADVGGQRELVREGTGMLVPTGRDRAARDRYLAALVALVADPARCRRMGEAARELVESEFSLPLMADGFERLCRELRETVPERAAVLDLSAAERSAAQAVAYLAAMRGSGTAVAGAGLPLKMRLYALIARLGNPLYFWCLERRWSWVVALKNRIRKAMAIDE